MKKYNQFIILLTIFIPILTIIFNLIYKFTDMLYINKFFYLYIFLCILSLLIYFKEIINMPKKILIPILLFLIVTFISSLLSPNYMESIFGKGSASVSGYISYLALFGVFVCAFTLEENKIKGYAKTFVVISLIIAFLTIIQNDLSYILLRVDLNKEYEYLGTFYQINHYGCYLLLTILCDIYFLLKSKNIVEYIFYLLGAFLLIYTLIRNNTLTAWLVLALAIFIIFIYCIKKKQIKKIGIFMLILILLIGIVLVFKREVIGIIFDNLKDVISNFKLLFTFEKDSIVQIGTYRVFLWEKTIPYIQKKPFIGYGVEAIREVFLITLGADKPHNFILELLLSGGIIGCISYLIPIFIIIIGTFRKRKIIKECELFSLLLCIIYLLFAFFNNSRLYTSSYFYILIGICYKSYINNKKIKSYKQN